MACVYFTVGLEALCIINACVWAILNVISNLMETKDFKRRTCSLTICFVY